MTLGSDVSFINVAPAPVLSWLKRLDDRVLGMMKMFPRMLIERRVEAADVAARQA
jgi:hypothetical protein